MDLPIHLPTGRRHPRHYLLWNRMIAILADPDDRLARLAHERLLSHGEDVEFLDAATLLRGAGLSWSLTPPEGFLDLGTSVLELASLRSVLARTTPASVDVEADDDETYSELEAWAAMLGLLSGLPGLVVNRPLPLDTHRPILARPRTVVDCGLKLAPTLVTSDPEAAARFFAEECHNQAIVGAPTAAGPPPSGDGPAPLSALSGSQGAEEISARVQQGPVAIQARPDGARLTVLVVGDGARAGAPDADGALRPVDLGAAVGAACVALARALGLSFAAVELVLERDEPTCLDVTGLPQVHRWSPDLEDAVVSALCLLLANGDGP